MKAQIGNINRYSLHDGPGIRNTVFFKGCQLHCPWCHNPELIDMEPVVAFYSEHCIACSDCSTACPQQAVDMVSEGRIDRSLCNGCGLCIEACPTGALATVGREYELEELVEILLRDRLFFDTSGGGVTLSGGEPTLQLSFLGELLPRLQREGIHTVLQTNGCFPYEEFASSCLDHINLILFDLKFINSDQHQEVIGCDNKVIMENLSKLLANRKRDVIVRIPIIPGYTATRENINGIAGFLHNCNAYYYSLLPYHPYGLLKATTVGLTLDRTLPEQAMDNSELFQWVDLFDGMVMVTP